MKKMINRVTVEGFLYNHNLEKKVTGERSKNPGTEYIRGSIGVATDNDLTNVININFSYVVPTLKSGSENPTYTALANIMSGATKTVMESGVSEAAKVRCNPSIELNEWYTDRDGTEELVSTKRYSGGFIHIANEISENERLRNEFHIDMLINGVRRLEATDFAPEKVIIKGCIFDFRNSVLPVEFSVLREDAMDYFESLEVSPKNPVLTRMKGYQISQTVIKTIEEQGAFGAPTLKEVKSSNKDWVVDWAQPEPYVFDDESTITEKELAEAIAARNTYLATLKAQNDEWKKNNSVPAAPKVTVAAGGFNF